MKAEMDRITQTPEDILNELRSLVVEAENILGRSPQEGNFEAAVAGIRERFEAAQERLTELYAEARRKVVAGAKYSDETIRTHPYQSIAIALGVGLLAGALLGRRWSSSSR